MFQGDTMETYVVEYTEDPDCPAHDRYDVWTTQRIDSTTSTVQVADRTTGNEVVEFEDEIVVSACCICCGVETAMMKRLAVLPRGAGMCQLCSEPLQLDVRQSATAGDVLWAWPLAELGYVDGDVITVRSDLERQHHVLALNT